MKVEAKKEPRILVTDVEMGCVVRHPVDEKLYMRCNAVPYLVGQISYVALESGTISTFLPDLTVIPVDGAFVEAS